VCVVVCQNHRQEQTHSPLGGWAPVAASPGVFDATMNESCHCALQCALQCVTVYSSVSC